jgi:diguanylate cyclase (GGDEF)-like protein/PAS domain S-box-containing protein
MTENNGAELDLSTRPALLDSIVSNSRDAILVTEAWPTDEPGPRIIYANDAFTSMTGYSCEEILGNTPRLLQGPGTDRARLDEIRAALDRREPVRTELLNYRKDGTEFWVEVDIVPATGEHGDHTHWVSIQREATERRQRQEALRESEERLRTILVQYASDLITILEADGTIRYQSPAVETVLGYEPRELTGQRLLDYIHPEDAGRVISGGIATGEAPDLRVPVEARIRHKDGSWRWLEGFGNNLLKDPSVGGIVLNSRNITRRKLAEEQLRAAEERYRTLVEQIPAVVYTLSPVVGEVGSYEISYMSPRVQEVLGYPAHRFTGDQGFWNGIIHPDDLAGVVAEDERTDESGEPFSMEYRMIARDGRVVWIRGESLLIRNPEGGAVYWQGVMTDVTQRRQAQDALRESEERYSSVAESIREVIFETDARGNYTFLNAAWQEITGFTVEASLGKSYLAFIHPDDLQRNLEDFESMGGHGGEYTEYGARFLVRDGSARDIEIKFREHFDGEGNMTGTSGTLNDITGRKKTERALQESERRFRQLFEQSVDAIYVHDEEGRFVDCNSRTCSLLGYTRGEFLSLHAADISSRVRKKWGTSRQRESITAWRQALQGDPGLYFQAQEDENIRKDGTTFPVETRIGSVDYGGRRMVLVSVRDITDRKENERALRESEARFRGAFEYTSTGMALIGLDNRYLRVNHALRNILGYTEGELLSRTTFDITHPEDQVKSRDRTRRILNEGGPGAMSLEKRYLRKDGGVLWAMSDASLIRDSNGEPSHFISHFQDITERKNLEERLLYQALHDPLTGLPNRSSLHGRFERLANRMSSTAQRRSEDDTSGGSRYVAVLFLDLDGFKELNDSLGHSTGDELLSAVAERLRHVVRPEDTVARLGGDEFCVLLAGISSAAEAIHIAERIKDSVDAPFSVSHDPKFVLGPARASEVSLSTSIGIAVSDEPGETGRPLDELLREADAAMYRAKKRGGALYEIVELPENTG